MRLLICGDRNWTNKSLIEYVIKQYQKYNDIEYIIEGESKGADVAARDIAITNHIDVLRFRADWNKYGKQAGPLRNTEMLVRGHPNTVLVFHNDIINSKGTIDMLKKSVDNIIPSYLYYSINLSHYDRYLVTRNNNHELQYIIEEENCEYGLSIIN